LRDAYCLHHQGNNILIVLCEDVISNTLLLLLFTLMEWDVSELLPLTGPLFIAQMTHEHGERQWNDIDRGKGKDLETNVSQRQSVHDKSNMDRPAHELGLSR
jgi:hypothetical protein